MLENAYAVILAGGRGERFWPLSTRQRPKQFLTLFGGRPLVALAVSYLDGLIPPERVLIITRAELVQATRRAAPSLPAANVIGEPFGRDTAAACALASALVQSRDPDGVFCILTADHVIEDVELFQTTLREGLVLAAHAPVLVTIGIQPTHPSTGFGYIETGAPLETGGTVEFLRARRFVEKPDPATAETYVQSGRHFWNAGMFLWSVKALQAGLAAHCPACLRMADRMAACAGTAEFDAQLREAYTGLDKISIDYALMEKSDNIVMAKGVFRWDDVGSWPALRNHFAADADGNVVIGDCERLDAGGNVVVSQARLTALIGVHDLVVVQAPNATLICHRDRAQDVKRLVQQLGQRDDADELI